VEADTKRSSPVQAAAESSPTSPAAESPMAESATGNSRSIQRASEPSATVGETPDASEAPVATETSPQATYRVIGIPPGDYLNVREEAGSDHQVITRLEPGTSGILLGTKRIASGATTWQEITIHGQTGWVNAAYIALETQSSTSPTESSTAP
jgi:hypothetical protein